MAWDDVKENINLVGFSEEQSAAIMADFQQAYENSPRARQLLDLATPDNVMEINFREDAAFAAPVTGRYAGEGFLTRGIYWDPDFVDDISIIDDTGTVGEFTQQYVLIHEAVHLLEGLRDLDEADRANGKHWTGDNDYVGRTEAVTKEILDELGIDMQRVSYASAGPRELLPVGTEYTNGEPIDAAVLTGGNPVYTDQEMRDESDLVVGVGNRGVDIRTGGGRDFANLGDGNDTIDMGSGNDDVVAGGGNDRIVDGRGNDTYRGGDGIDTLDFRPRGPAPLDVVVGAEGMEFTRDRGEFLGSEVDRAEGIEVVTTGGGIQSARIEGLEATSYIDLGEGDDRVVLSGELDGAYVLSLEDGRVPRGEPGAGRSYTATVSNGEETLYLTGVADERIVDERDVGAAPVMGVTLDEAAALLAHDAQDPEVQAILADAPEVERVPDMLDELRAAGVEELTFDTPLPDTPKERFAAVVEATEDAHTRMLELGRGAGTGAEAGAEAGADDAHGHDHGGEGQGEGRSEDFEAHPPYHDIEPEMEALL